jgi:hypothetical protein
VPLAEAVTVGVNVLVLVPGELLVILGEPDVVFDDDIEDVTVLLINPVKVRLGELVVEGDAELVFEPCIDLLDVLLVVVVLELGGDLLDVGQEVEVLDTDVEEVVVFDNPDVFVPVVVPVFVLELKLLTVCNGDEELVFDTVVVFVDVVEGCIVLVDVVDGVTNLVL